MNQNTTQQRPQLRLIVSPDYIELEGPRAPLIVRDQLKDPVDRNEFLDFLMGRGKLEKIRNQEVDPPSRLELEDSLCEWEKLLDKNPSGRGQLNRRAYVVRYLQWRCEKRLISCASSLLGLTQEEVAAKYKEFSEKNGGRSDAEFYDWIYAEMERNRDK